MNMISIRSFALLLTAISLGLPGNRTCQGQAPPVPGKKATTVAPHSSVLKGRIVFNDSRSTAPNGDSLKIEFTDLEARLREYVELPPPPYPEGFQSWEMEQQNKWLQEFSETAAGKAIIEANRIKLEAARSFEIQFDASGNFTVYDVPAGEYAIQGRTDKAIGETDYAFEVFGQLTVSADVDEVLLKPIQIEITPLLKTGQTAPPLRIDAVDGTSQLKPEQWQGKLLLLNFWSLADTTAVEEQSQIQQLVKNLRADAPLELLSINVDNAADRVREFVATHHLELGIQGLAGGPDNPTLFYYGVRGVPSYWLIGDDGKILMSPQEIGAARQTGAQLETILQQRIAGTDQPIPAEPRKDGQ